MNCECWFLGVTAALLAVGCGSSDSGSDNGISDAASAGFVGIYQTTGYSENSASCDAPGASTLDTLQDKYFLVAPAVELGIHLVSLVSCNSVSDCQTKRTAVTSAGFYSYLYSYTLTSVSNATTLTGFEATTGFSSANSTMCTGRTYADHTLTLNADHSLHLESRTKDLADKPQQDGFCEVDPAQSKQEAASAPCSDLKVVDGTFVQAM
jgi:hypothetical protein